VLFQSLSLAPALARLLSGKRALTLSLHDSKRALTLPLQDSKRALTLPLHDSKRALTLSSNTPCLRRAARAREEDLSCTNATPCLRPSRRRGILTPSTCTPTHTRPTHITCPHAHVASAPYTHTLSLSLTHTHTHSLTHTHTFPYTTSHTHDGHTNLIGAAKGTQKLLFSGREVERTHEHRPCHTFSKVSAMVHFLYTATIERTFENGYLDSPGRTSSLSSCVRCKHTHRNTCKDTYGTCVRTHVERV